MLGSFLLVMAGFMPSQTPVPRFERYPAAAYCGMLAAPRLTTSQKRRFRSEFRQAVSKGYDVVDGGTEHERVGPNFAGHYLLVQWGCGSDCMEAALVDARDGTVLRLPQIAEDRGELSYFGLPTGSVDFRTLEFRLRSRLLGIPRIGDGKTYYYVLDGHQWRFLTTVATPEEHP